MARTLADQLAQPLTQLIVTLELWQAGYYADEPPAALWARLERASHELARRFAQIARARSYVPREQAGFVLLDIDRAGGPTE